MSEPLQRKYLDANKAAWYEPDGTMHVDAVRFCEVLGIEPTKQNQDMLEEELRKLMAREHPDVPVKSISDLLT